MAVIVCYPTEICSHVKLCLPLGLGAFWYWFWSLSWPDVSDIDNLQRGIDNLAKWTERWQVKLNINKCKVISVHHRRYTDSGLILNYVINNIKLDEVDEIKDLGVTYDSLLLFDKHISEKVNKAYTILGIIKRNFTYISRKCFVILYKSLVRSHLEYANSVWYPKRKTDVDKLERV